MNEQHIFNKINHDDNFQVHHLFSKLSCFKEASLENNSSNKKADFKTLDKTFNIYFTDLVYIPGKKAFVLHLELRHFH